jgi:hypothetical protein
MTDVKIGDANATISKLNGYKAAEALGIISEITEATPGLLHDLADFTRTYEREHAQQMPRAAAEAKFPTQARNVSEEAWAAAGNVLAVPEPPGIEEQIAFALPKVYKVARESLIDLLALLITPNSELEKYDAEGEDLYGREGALAEQRRKLLHDASLEQLVDVAAGAGDVLREQLRAIDGGQLGKLLEVFGLKTGQPSPSPSSPEPSAPSASEPGSSSPSAEASDGPAATSSSASPSERSEPQPAS